MRQLTTIRTEEDWIITRAVIEGIGLFFQAFFGMIKGLLEAAWENLPVFLELKKVLGYVSPEGVFAICAGVPLCLVSVTSWGLKKLLTKDNR